MTEYERVTRLERSREKAEIPVIWDSEDFAAKGDKVEMSQKVMGDRALAEDGKPRAGVVDDVLSTGVRAVRFDQPVVGTRRHLWLHRVELKIIERAKR